MRVFGWQTHTRNESEFGGILGAPSTGLDILLKDLSKSKEGSRRANYPILTRGGSDNK